MGSSSISLARATPPSKAATSFSSNTSRIMSAASLLILGANSFGFIIAQLPAAIMDTKGAKSRAKGKFQGLNKRTIPLPSVMIRARLSTNGVGSTSTGAIQLASSSTQCSISP